MKLTSAQLDRAAGVLLGMACGDALGAGYEFGPPLPAGSAVTMRGGGGFDWAPGEWTDDTSMAVPIIRAIAEGKDLRDESVLDEIVAAWVAWARIAPDVGNQLRAVLSRTDSDLTRARSERVALAAPNGTDSDLARARNARAALAAPAPDLDSPALAATNHADSDLARAGNARAVLAAPAPALARARSERPDPALADPAGPASAAPAKPEADAAPEHAGAASAVRLVAQAHHDRHGRSGGNGSLMRTAPVALAFLDDPAALAETARAISDLTHVDTDAGDACVLWCLAIRHAVVSGTLDVRVGLNALPAERHELWESRLLAAEAGTPSDFDHNGWVVEALQGAWSAITESLRPGTETAATDTTATNTAADHLRRALEGAVRGGRDTDTVAAIAGGLLGARYGASAVPAEWRRIVHGWPGLRADELVRLGVLAARATGRRTPAAGPSPFAGRARRADVAILAGRVSLGVRADDGRGRRDPARPPNVVTRPAPTGVTRPAKTVVTRAAKTVATRAGPTVESRWSTSPRWTSRHPTAAPAVTAPTPPGPPPTGWPTRLPATSRAWCGIRTTTGSGWARSAPWTCSRTRSTRSCRSARWGAPRCPSASVRRTGWRSG